MLREKQRFKGRYKAGFIIPMNAEKILGDGGWDFISSNRLSVDIKDYLIKALQLTFLEKYSEIEVYVCNDIKMSVSFDDQNQIELIDFQLYEDAMSKLSEVWASSLISSQAELFIPSAIKTSQSTVSE